MVDIRFISRDRRKVEGFLDEAFAIDPLRGTICINTLNDDNFWDEHARGRIKRSLDTVFVNANDRDDLIQRIQGFIDNELWYVERGLNYKLVVMLYGPPGTGKTSLIQAIASHFNKDIYLVPDLERIECAVSKASGIVAIEDIDTMRMDARTLDEEEMRAPDRRNKKAATGNPAMGILQDNLNAVLNVLDGLSTPHGMIAIMTTNQPEMLDAALMRPCRIDISKYIGPLEFPAFADMFASFYGRRPRADLASDWKAVTSARLQEIFTTHDCHAAEQLLTANEVDHFSKPDNLI